MKINKLINGYYIWGNGTVTLQRINNRKTPGIKDKQIDNLVYDLYGLQQRKLKLFRRV